MDERTLSAWIARPDGIVPILKTIQSTLERRNYVVKQGYRNLFDEYEALLAVARDSLVSWRQNHPEVWATAAHNVSQVIANEQSVFRKSYGLLETPRLCVLLDLISRERSVLLYALTDDPWQIILKLAADRMGLALTAIAESQLTAVQSSALLIRDFIGWSVRDYGSLRILLDAVSDEPQSALFGLSLRQDRPEPMEDWDSRRIEPGCFRRVYPVSIYDDRDELTWGINLEITQLQEAIYSVIIGEARPLPGIKICLIDHIPTIADATLGRKS